MCSGKPMNQALVRVPHVNVNIMSMPSFRFPQIPVERYKKDEEFDCYNKIAKRILATFVLQLFIIRSHALRDIV